MGHGGMHPTPWPTPPGPPTPAPEPTPDPEPAPSPTPEPAPPDNGPAPTDDPRKDDPRWSGSQKSIEKATWKQWWEINNWRYTRPARKEAAVTGPESDVRLRLVKFLEKQLQHSYFDVRSAAAIALGKIQAREAASSIMRLMDDPNPITAESAVLALGMTRDSQALPALAAMVADRKKPLRLRIHAAVALGIAGDEAASSRLEELVSAENENEEVKAAALLALSLLKTERAGMVMTGQLTAERARRDLKAVAATGLGKLGGRTLKFGKQELETVKYLLYLLQTMSREETVRQSAAISISALAPASEMEPKLLVRSLAFAMNDKDLDTRNFLLMALAETARAGKAQEEARAVIRGMLLKAGGQSETGFACVAAGLAQDRQSIPHLRKLLESAPSPDVRAAAAVGLGLIKDIGATPALLEIIGSKGDTVLRGYCCVALGVMAGDENREALPVLKKILSSEPDPELRAASSVALARLGDPEALRILLAALSDRNQYFRMSAVMSIGHLRDMAAIEPLIELYESQGVNDELKAIICVALGNIADPSPEPALKKIGEYYNFMLTRFTILKQIVNLL